MSIKDGIILAGGTGSRLLPLTNIMNKHLVPLGDKFIIDYPLSTLKNIGIENLTVVLGGAHFSQVVDHLKDGDHLGMNINYVYQDKPSGIAQAVNLCERFIPKNNNVRTPFVVLLGDNVFTSKVDFSSKYQANKAQIVLYKHKELNRFGVASICNEKITHLEEKPKVLDSKLDHYAITGCYMFDDRFFTFFKNTVPSA